MMPSPLPAELQNLADLIDDQPQQVRELFHYALAMLLVENQKAEIIKTETREGHTYSTLKTIAGEQFTVVKPKASNQLLEKLMAMARDVLEEDEK